MRLKTFVGVDLHQTLAQVKRELGPEAIILSTQSRRVAAGGNGRPRREIEVIAALPGSQGGGGEPESPGSGPLPLLSALYQELRELKGLMRRHLEDPGAPAWLKAHPEAAALYQRLTETGLGPGLREKWLTRVRPLLARPGEGGRESQTGWQALLGLFPVGKQEVPGSRAVVLVGASGVGKTTTLAKLAVRAALLEGRRVGLISLDQERLGAVEQLQAVARLADLPLYPAGSREEVTRGLEKLSHCETVFIDTPGANPCLPGLGEELRRLLGDLPLECHLLLPATGAPGHLALSLRTFRSLPLASLILTKVDETQELAGCLTQACLSGLPVSYLTTGPRIPEDLEPATPARLAALLLSGPPDPEVPRPFPLGVEVFRYAET